MEKKPISLDNRIEALLHEDAPDFAIAQVLKEELSTYMQTLPQAFARSGGKDFLVKHTRQIDRIITWAYRAAVRGMYGEFVPPANALPLALAALGSYGREQLGPRSDIDLMIVYRDIPGYCHQALIEKILYLLWDAGLKLGHRVHEAGELLEISRTDITIKTALIESRFIIGSRFVWTQAQNQITLIRRDDPEAFIRAKIEELRRLHARYDLTMEPHLKEGVGGFRDANLVYWIGTLLYGVPRIRELPASIVDSEDYRMFRIALEFLFRVRSALHLTTGKKEDRLRLQNIPDVARLLGYGSAPRDHTRLARRVVRSLKTVRLYSTIWLEALVGKHTPDMYAHLLPLGEELRTFEQALAYLTQHAAHPFVAHPALLHALIRLKRPERPTARHYRLIRRIFEQPHAYAVLTTLSGIDLLGFVIPPLRKVIDLPQFDGYHAYAVDIHSLRALHALESPKDDPLLDRLYSDLSDKHRRLLKIVTLLHDAGKGRKRDHHAVGASLFRVFGRKIGLGAHELAEGERLILHHTLMSTTAQREDLYSEKTILRFASRFDTPQRLAMIYLLTYADLRAVGSDVWSPFVAQLLQTLYRASLEVLERTEILDETARRLRRIESLHRSRTFAALPRPIQTKILSIPSNAFFIRHTTAQIVAIGAAAYATQRLHYTIDTAANLHIEIIRRGTIDIACLLARLARLNVLSMAITQLFDDRKYFRIDFGERVDSGEIPQIEATIEAAFGGTCSATYHRPTLTPEAITIDCDHSREYATLRLRARDQKGLLAYLIHRFDAHGIEVASTKIHTIKGRVNDLFLIEKNGNFCHNIENLIAELTE